MKTLIAYEVALAHVMSRCALLPSELVPIHDLLGRFTVEPLISRVDMPRFDNSAVDGYAVRTLDVQSAPVSLRVAGQINAGEGPAFKLGSCEAARIYTGAALPDGCDAVVMQEDAEREGDTVIIGAAPTLGQHIRRRGEEHSEGQELLPAGTLCTPAVIGLIATAGHAHMSCPRLPRISIIATGDELVAPGRDLASGQIYESNSLALVAGLRALGLLATSERVPDHHQATTDALARALDASDVVITSGGVSVGDRDYVKAALEELGVERQVWGVAARPGQPFYFGTRGDKLVFGLAGNPVSALVNCFVFVRPAIIRLIGGSSPGAHASRLLTKEPLTKKAGRLEFVRGREVRRGVESWVEPIAARGSHMLGGMAGADCLIHFPSEADQLDEGQEVQITPLKWSLV